MKRVNKLGHIKRIEGSEPKLWWIKSMKRVNKLGHIKKTEGSEPKLWLFNSPKSTS